MTTDSLETAAALARQLRVDSIRSSSAAGSGHPTSSLSAADLMAVLLTRHLRYDWNDPGAPSNDHLIFSKGHASPLLYSMFRAVGVVSEHDLLTEYRRLGSVLEGHPTPALPWVDVATGSLGQGLPDAVGVALAGKRLDKIPYHVWVLCGDSEMSEGSMWEAFDKAAFYELGNLTAIVDVNRLGQRGPTELQWDLDAYLRRVEAFGCHGVVIDGHDLDAIDAALSGVDGNGDRPLVVLAKTIKGKGVPQVENENGWHGKVLPPEIAEPAIAALGGPTNLSFDLPKPRPPVSSERPQSTDVTLSLPTYELGDSVATRKAFGDTLAALAALPDVVALDGEVGNSTFVEEFLEVAPDRYFEMYIAEQQLVAAAVGMSVRGYVPFAATFAAFFTRAYDFKSMSAISRADIRLVGTHAGVEIGPDGPSQMGLEDLASMRAVHGSVVLYPSDAVSTVALVREMADTSGIVYLRATRGAYPVIYGNDETFTVGGSKVVRQSDADLVTLIGAGVTLHECLSAAEELAQAGIPARVIDLYSIKPLDRDTVIDALRATEGRVVVVEDHYAEGGIAEAVLAELADAGELTNVRVAHLAVRTLPGSGKSAELLDAVGISAPHIVEAARALVGK